MPTPHTPETVSATEKFSVGLPTLALAFLKGSDPKKLQENIYPHSLAEIKDSYSLLDEDMNVDDTFAFLDSIRKHYGIAQEDFATAIILSNWESIKSNKDKTKTISYADVYCQIPGGVMHVMIPATIAIAEVDDYQKELQLLGIYDTLFASARDAYIRKVDHTFRIFGKKPFVKYPLMHETLYRPFDRLLHSVAQDYFGISYPEEKENETLTLHQVDFLISALRGELGNILGLMTEEANQKRENMLQRIQQLEDMRRILKRNTQ